MRSTGEVMGIDETFSGAYAKAQAQVCGCAPGTRGWGNVHAAQEHPVACALLQSLTGLFRVMLTPGVDPPQWLVKPTYLLSCFNCMHELQRQLKVECAGRHKLLMCLPLHYLQIAAGQKLPMSGSIFVSMADKYKLDIVPIARELADLGYKLVATLQDNRRGMAKVGLLFHAYIIGSVVCQRRVNYPPCPLHVLNHCFLLLAAGTAKTLSDNGVPCEVVYKIHEGRPNPTDLMRNGDIKMILMTNSNDDLDRTDGRCACASVAAATGEACTCNVGK
eukprot:1155797-Pelagomonas_calceolata.AAC.1